MSQAFEVLLLFPLQTLHRAGLRAHAWPCTAPPEEASGSAPERQRAVGSGRRLRGGAGRAARTRAGILEDPLGASFGSSRITPEHLTAGNTNTFNKQKH